MPNMDPSIYQNAFKPTVALQDPMDSMGKAMQMKHAMQQQEMGALQLQQQKQKDWAEITKAQRETQAAAANLTETQGRLFANVGGAVLQAHEAGKPDVAQAAWDTGIKQAQSMGMDTSTMPPQYDPKLAAGYFHIGVSAMDRYKRGESDGEITGGIHADPQNNAFGVTKKGVPVPILGPDGKPQKMRPPGTATAGLPGMGGGGGGKIDDEYLASLNPVDRDMITKIALGKYGGLDALKRTKGGQAKIEAFVRAGGDVSQVNNAVKWQEDARKTTPGSVGGTYLSVNKSLEHAQRALDVADQFPKEAPSDGGVIDYWSQRAKNTAWAVANPGKAKPLEHNWQITTSALLDETEKNILGGKPSVDQARTIEKLRTMPFTATKAEKDAAIQAVMDLTMGQYDAVENQRQQIQGKFAKADSMLSPKSQEIWANFNKRIGRKGEAPGSATPPRTSLDAGSPTSSAQGQPGLTKPKPTVKSQAEYDALPMNSDYLDANGIPHHKGGR